MALERLVAILEGDIEQLLTLSESFEILTKSGFDQSTIWNG